MPQKTKRQLQVNTIPRKKGRFVSKNQAEAETEAAVERGEHEIDKNWIEDEDINDWTNEDLREFEEAGKRLVTEVLRWHKDAKNHIRAAYNGNSRTTVWRNKKKKEELMHDAMGMKTLDALFKNTTASTSIPLPQSSQPQFSSPSPSQSSLITEEVTRNLQIRLEEINQKCSITKSAKTNKNIFTYDYLRCLSIRRYIQLLLDGRGKMDASNQIAQTMWNKGDYIARCIRKWGAHFIQTGELLVYRQGKHTKLESTK